MPKQPTVTPPIPDSNKNGVLDGKDVLAQMKAEERNGGERDSSERAHGVFEALGTRILTNQLINAAQQDRVDATIFDRIATSMNALIKREVTETRKKMDQDPNFDKRAEEYIRTESKKHGLSQFNTDLNAADDRSFNDFARTFSSTFPKGVKIEAEDVKGILEHFVGGEAITIPSVPAPASGKKSQKTP